jgi:hypothetical protein
MHTVNDTRRFADMVAVPNRELHLSCQMHTITRQTYQIIVCFTG